MSDMSKLEKAKAALEARDSVARAGTSSAAVPAAMRRYLSAERYHELKDQQRERGHDARRGGDH
jgi:hypothetical protein